MSFVGARGNQIITFLVRQNLKRNTTRCISSVVCNRILPNFQRTRLGVDLTSSKQIIFKWSETGLRRFASLPQHVKVPLPALSPTMEMGTIVSWAKKEGDKLNEGDLLAEIETDKATMGFETPDEGYLAKIVVAAGTKNVPVGKLVCIIVEKESDVVAFKDFKDDGAVVSPVAAVGGPPPPAPTPPAPPKPSVPLTSRAEPLTEKGRIYASPMAKKLAEKKSIRLESVTGRSGVYDSVKSKDVETVKPGAVAKRAAPRMPPGVPYIDIPVSNIRAVIAKRLLQSKNTIPHYYLTVDCVMDEVMALRKSFNDSLAKQKVKISVNDFILKATAMACREVPEANSAWMDSFIRQYNTVDISVAVSTDRGLITPIVFNADLKGLVEISNDVKDLATRAREGKLQPHEFQGGTICVSNLGMFGIDQFCAIINPPQACILAVGRSTARLVPEKGSPNGVAKNFMAATLSADHRIVDGAIGAQWLSAFRDFIEHPIKMIL